MSYSLPLSLFMQLINVRFVFVGDWGEEGRGRGKMGWNGWESLLLLSHTLSSFSLALLFFLSFSPTPTLSFFLSVFPSRSLSLFFFLSFFLSALSLSLSLSFFRSFFIFFFLPFPSFSPLILSGDGECERYKMKYKIKDKEKTGDIVKEGRKDKKKE